MTSSFAAFASQMITRPPPSSSTNTEDNPMFFSFISDTSNGRRRVQDVDDDDDDDPHLRMEDSLPVGEIEDEEDPFLGGSETSSADEGGGGWLAHQGQPLPPPRTIHGPSPPRQHITLPPSPSLTASLLPPRSLLPDSSPFTPPDIEATPSRHVHTPRRPITYTDAPFLALLLTTLTLTLITSLILLFHAPPHPKTYSRLLKSVPLLTLLTALAAAISYLQLYLLSLRAREVMLASAALVPLSTAICSLWAFGGSFQGDGSWTLRLLSFPLMAFAVYTARNLTNLPNASARLLPLVTVFLRAHPRLLALSPAVLLGVLLLSIPFVAILFRIEAGGWWWCATAAAWAWTWGVGRGIMRVAVAAEVAERSREVEGALGSVALGTLILTIVRLAALLTTFLLRLPFGARFVAFCVSYLEDLTASLSRYALVYAGLTGEEFFPSARKAAALRTPNVMRPPTLSILLTAPLTLPLPAFLLIYFASKEWEASIVGGAVVGATAWLCVGVVRDVADAFWVICLLDDGEREWVKEVREVFAYQPKPKVAQARPRPVPEASVYAPPRAQTRRPPTPVYTPPRAPPVDLYEEREPDIDPFITASTPQPPAHPSFPMDESVTMSHSNPPFHSQSQSGKMGHSRQTSKGMAMGMSHSRQTSSSLPDSDSEEDEDEDGGLYPGSGLFGDL